MCPPHSVICFSFFFFHRVPHIFHTFKRFPLETPLQPHLGTAKVAHRSARGHQQPEAQGVDLTLLPGDGPSRIGTLTDLKESEHQISLDIGDYQFRQYLFEKNRLNKLTILNM